MWVRGLKFSLHSKVHIDIGNHVITYLPEALQQHVKPSSGLYGKSFELIFDEASQAEEAKEAMASTKVPLTDDTGFAHMLTVQVGKSFPALILLGPLC